MTDHDRNELDSHQIARSTLFDHIHDAVITTDIDGIITGWNRGAERQLGYSAQEVIGQPIYLLYPSERHDVSQREVIALLERQGRLEFEAVMRRKSGEEMFVHTSISPLADEHGVITGMVSYTIDISARKRAEEALRAQAMVIDQIHDAVITTDRSGTVTGWNRGAERQLGYTAAEAMGRPVYFVYPEQGADTSQEEVMQMLDRHGRLDFESVMRTKTGELIDVHTSLSGVRDAKGATVGVVSYSLDISSRRRAEEARRDAVRLERELDIARTIQRSLLPDEQPVVPGFEIAGWNQPAAQTGGDYFDWITLPDGRTVVSIADVSGHGIGPALIVAVCRAYFRASTSVEMTLQSAIARANDLLARDLTEGRFVTAAVGMLDPATRRMHLYSAGHAPLIYYEAASGTVHLWAADDPPLGLLEGVMTGAPREIAFAPGDALVLVTDGFYEWSNAAGDKYGIPRLEEFVRTHASRAPKEFIEALYADVQAFAGDTPQADDVTAVVIRRHGR
jgi:PAS domain S-box-containing protein